MGYHQGTNQAIIFRSQFFFFETRRAFLLKVIIEAGKRAEWAKALAVEPDNLVQSPGLTW